VPGLGTEAFIGNLLTYGLPNAIAALLSGVSVGYVFRTLRSLVWCSYEMVGDQQRTNNRFPPAGDDIPGEGESLTLAALSFELVMK